ncbi:hypothetical protein DAI22_04g035800 [Oryza sativa Japonica Group]|nr:hypothetical protein DAI22_04g035800 [Oryza sativa Japonica Group]KAF2932906.1 hypothetical protein DAI22_04g035800 [Oryza sativa Japonica Group]
MRRRWRTGCSHRGDDRGTSHPDIIMVSFYVRTRHGVRPPTPYCPCLPSTAASPSMSGCVLCCHSTNEVPTTTFEDLNEAHSVRLGNQ